MGKERCRNIWEKNSYLYIFFYFSWICTYHFTLTCCEWISPQENFTAMKYKSLFTYSRKINHSTKITDTKRWCSETIDGKTCSHVSSHIICQVPFMPWQLDESVCTSSYDKTITWGRWPAGLSPTTGPIRGVPRVRLLVVLVVAVWVKPRAWLGVVCLHDVTVTWVLLWHIKQHFPCGIFTCWI